MKKIIVLTTGGTIEKTYDESDGSLRNGPSIFKAKILSQLRLPSFQFDVKEVFSKDSLDINDEERSYLASFIGKELEAGVPIIVIHGTDTMDLSGRKCLSEHKNTKVPIIFTGAMKPTDIKDTDALQNVTEAIVATQLAPPGVYISFHGNLFPADQCKKNKITMTFESIS